MRYALYLYASGIDIRLCAAHKWRMIEAADIKAAREALKESQAAFAARFGVDQSTVHRWETRGPPKRPLVQKVIARAIVLPRDASSDGGA